MPEGTLDVEQSNHYYFHDKVPAEGKYYLPVQCQQCDEPPCVNVCPVKATWKEEDGIVSPPQGPNKVRKLLTKDNVEIE